MPKFGPAAEKELEQGILLLVGHNQKKNDVEESKLQ